MDKGMYGRKDRLLKKKRQDAYQANQKLPEPTICKKCGACYEHGHWSWKELPENALEVICPACRRIKDKYPAGFIEIKGKFFNTHRTEILNLINNVEKKEKGERPLERIMAVTDQRIHTLITTTGIHLARRIGEALSHSYHGDYSFIYSDAEKCIRVYWKL